MSQAVASEADPGHRAAVEVRILQGDDWPELRTARLKALVDAPEAFVTIHAAAEVQLPGVWRATLNDDTWVAASMHGEIVGIACLTGAGRRPPGQRFVESVWVRPDLRRGGIVRRMLTELEKSARTDGHEQLQLWVLETNDPARDAYIKLGFHEVEGSRQKSPKRLPDLTRVLEVRMVRPLFL